MRSAIKRSRVAKQMLELAAKSRDLRFLAELSATLETRRAIASNAVLTVLTNDAGHLIPRELVVGDYFVASRGSFDISSAESIRQKYISILKRLHRRLTSKRYRTVFLIATGPVTLNMQVKALIRDVLRVHTIDYAYFEGRYMPIAIEFRKDIYDRRSKP